MKERITVTAPPEVVKRIKAQALAENRNFSNMVSVLLKEALDKKTA